MISEAHLRYHIGDRVDINCTLYRSNPATATELRWYINGEQADSTLLKQYSKWKCYTRWLNSLRGEKVVLQSIAFSNCFAKCLQLSAFS